MKSCPTCQRLFVDSERHCALDNSALEPSSAPPKAGLDRKLGPYRLISQLGEGGMSTIYIGRHVGLGRCVAIKLLRPELGSRRDNVARFFQEAHTINRLRHPNIVESVDLVDDPAEGAYCVLELLQGPDLKTRLARGPIPIGSAIHIGVQIADALGAVHALGVVHRDLKPDNLILIQRDGRDDFVKLIDFGIAQIGQQSDANVVGTAAYMAPEQGGAGAVVDRRADVYSLGVILFEMVTGRHPFPSSTDSEYLIHHANTKPPKPSKLMSRCPPALEAIILRCLAKRPDQRFASADQVAAALRLLDPKRAGASIGMIASAMFLVGGAAGAAYLLVPRYFGESSAKAAEAAVQPRADITESPSAPPSPPATTVTPEPSGTAAPEVAAPSGTAAEDVAAPEVEDPAPTIVEIDVVSTPPGAKVFRVGETIPLGITPFTVQLSRSDKPTRMRFELRGHQTKQIEVPLAASLEIDVTLPRQREASTTAPTVKFRKPTSKPAETSPKTKPTVQREGVMDPFAN